MNVTIDKAKKAQEAAAALASGDVSAALDAGLSAVGGVDGIAGMAKGFGF